MAGSKSPRSIPYILLRVFQIILAIATAGMSGYFLFSYITSDNFDNLDDSNNSNNFDNFDNSDFVYKRDAIPIYSSDRFNDYSNKYLQLRFFR
jgi:hypothetical protein